MDRLTIDDQVTLFAQEGWFLTRWHDKICQTTTPPSKEHLLSSNICIVLALVVALVVGFGYRAYDTAHGAEWAVSPEQVAAAKAAGKPGVETSPGTVAVLPIRSELAGVLTFKWIFAGVVAGALVMSATRRPTVKS